MIRIKPDGTIEADTPQELQEYMGLQREDAPPAIPVFVPFISSPINPAPPIYPGWPTITWITSAGT